jgi:hypothetical protein
MTKRPTSFWKPSQGPHDASRKVRKFTFYDPDKSHGHVVGTAGDCEAAGSLMRREARRLHLTEAKVKYAVSDGAEWIANQYRQQLPMTDYPRFRQLGYDCGSGPTESLCGRLTARLKGPGMRWDKSNAEAMMALASLYHSRQWDLYWKSERAAA